MPLARLVMMTRANGMEGFPALLWEMLWHANFTYQLEYFVYARSLGAGLDECVVKVILRPRLVEGEIERMHTY